MITLLKDLARLRPLFTTRDVRKLAFLFVMMLMAAVMEAVGVGAVPAFVALVMKPSSLSDFGWIGHWFEGLPDEITVSIFLWASAGLLVFVLIKNSFLAFVYYVQARIVSSQRVKLGARMFRTYQSAPYEWHLQRNSSDLIRSLQTDIVQVLAGVVTPALSILMALLMSGLIIGVLVLSTPGVTLMALLVTAVGLFAVNRAFQKQLRQMGKVGWREGREMINAIQQGFGSIAEARIIGCEDYLAGRYQRSLARTGMAQRRTQTINKITPYVMEFFAVLGLLFILALLIGGNDELGSILPVIALFGVVMMRLKQFAGQIANALNTANHARAFIPKLLRDYHELQSTAEGSRRSTALHEQTIGDFRSLVLEGVSYRYPNSTEFAVQDVSVRVVNGESIALVGTTGCGKSTLVNVVLGLLECESGQVLVNGVDILDDIDGWRSKLGYIPQATYLIDDTIRANVAFGLEEIDIDDERVWQALRSARLDAFVTAMPEGLNTMVGERGVRLSGGERQRLGIARALYTDPQVLVMDEATSALDNKTEEEVMSAIQDIKKGRTLIMIAHRLSTVEDCDRLYMLKDGAVIAEGAYDELVKASVPFREMALASGSES